jgi:hypothetical protein
MNHKSSVVNHQPSLPIINHPFIVQHSLSIQHHDNSPRNRPINSPPKLTHSTTLRMALCRSCFEAFSGAELVGCLLAILELGLGGSELGASFVSRAQDVVFSQPLTAWPVDSLPSILMVMSHRPASSPLPSEQSSSFYRVWASAMLPQLRRATVAQLLTVASAISRLGLRADVLGARFLPECMHFLSQCDGEELGALLSGNPHLLVELLYCLVTSNLGRIAPSIAVRWVAVCQPHLRSLTAAQLVSLVWYLARLGIDRTALGGRAWFADWSSAVRSHLEHLAGPEMTRMLLALAQLGVTAEFLDQAFFTEWREEMLDLLPQLPLESLLEMLHALALFPMKLREELLRLRFHLGEGTLAAPYHSDKNAHAVSQAWVEGFRLHLGHVGEYTLVNVIVWLSQAGMGHALLGHAFFEDLSRRCVASMKRWGTQSLVRVMSGLDALRAGPGQMGKNFFLEWVDAARPRLGSMSSHQLAICAHALARLDVEVMVAKAFFADWTKAWATCLVDSATPHDMQKLLLALVSLGAAKQSQLFEHSFGGQCIAWCRSRLRSFHRREMCAIVVSLGHLGWGESKDFFHAWREEWVRARHFQKCTLQELCSLINGLGHLRLSSSVLGLPFYQAWASQIQPLLVGASPRLSTEMLKALGSLGLGKDELGLGFFRAWAACVRFMDYSGTELASVIWSLGVLELGLTELGAELFSGWSSAMCRSSLVRSHLSIFHFPCAPLSVSWFIRYLWLLFHPFNAVQARSDPSSRAICST